MKCFTVRRLLQDIVDDVQDQATRAARRHLDDCPGCRAEYEQLAGTRRQLASLAPGPASDELVERTLAAVDAALAAPPVGTVGAVEQPSPPRLTRLVASHAVAALLGAAAVLLLWLGSWGPNADRAEREGAAKRTDVVRVDVEAPTAVDGLAELPGHAAELAATGSSAVEARSADPAGAPSDELVIDAPGAPPTAERLAAADVDAAGQPAMPRMGATPRAVAPVDASRGVVAPLSEAPRPRPWLALRIDGDAVGGAIERLTTVLEGLPARVTRAAEIARSRPTWRPAPEPATSAPALAAVDDPAPTPELLAVTHAPADEPVDSRHAADLSPRGVANRSVPSLAAVDPSPTRASVVIRRFDDHVEIVTRSAEQAQIVPQLIAYLDDPDPGVAAAARGRLEMIREELGDPEPPLEEPPRAEPGLLARLFYGGAAREQPKPPSETEVWHAWWSSRGTAATSF